MVEKKVANYLNKLGSYLREKYPSETTEDLEHIARRVFNVNHIYHSFKDGMPGTNCASIDDGVISIHYKVYIPEAGKVILGHEMGHIAAGHLHSRVVPEKEGQAEADYFSARLNGLTDKEYNRIMGLEMEYIHQNIWVPMRAAFEAVFADINSVLYGTTQPLRQETDSLHKYAAELRETARSFRQGGLFWE